MHIGIGRPSQILAGREKALNEFLLLVSRGRVIGAVAGYLAARTCQAGNDLRVPPAEAAGYKAGGRQVVDIEEVDQQPRTIQGDAFSQVRIDVATKVCRQVEFLYIESDKKSLGTIRILQQPSPRTMYFSIKLKCSIAERILATTSALVKACLVHGWGGSLCSAMRKGFYFRS